MIYPECLDSVRRISCDGRKAKRPNKKLRYTLYTLLHYGLRVTGNIGLDGTMVWVNNLIEQSKIRLLADVVEILTYAIVFLVFGLLIV